MDSSVSGKDEIWFLRLCHHVPHELYHHISFIKIKVKMSFYITATQSILHSHQQDDDVITLTLINVTEYAEASNGACAMDPEVLFFVCLCPSSII